ncbi:hypothetical protein [Kineobactrum salinum]|uniref:Uncharacterized protein n=1 Tax=Kineobactrum salinum TaxID=2708301 RepID=A0A6C0U268_9GAMM|nr:hypothetical protein [Kineobactrum salinum]QIB65569.1 hypothetical protein G3T16_09285 [Kineobactrum salinum]
MNIVHQRGTRPAGMSSAARSALHALQVRRQADIAVRGLRQAALCKARLRLQRG